MYILTMTTHKFPLVGYATGITIIISCIIRWFFIYYDPSQMILGIGFGFGILSFSYIFNWMIEKDINDKKLNKRVDGFSDWLSKGEFN